MASQPIINPLTPLAYLPSDVAVQFEASRYLYIAVFAAFLWDWLMSMNDEYRMIRKSGGKSFPVIVYFMTRFAALGYLLAATMFQTASVPNCNGLLLATSVFFIFTMPLSSFLFYLRVWAVFHGNFLVQSFFAFLWLCVFGTSMLIPFALKGDHIGPTNYCINSAVQSYASTPVIVSTVNDTLIFTAISYKLVSDQRNSTAMREIGTSFFRGDGLSLVSKSLYKGGQLYYLSTVGMNILTMAMALTPTAPPVYRAMVTVPNIGLQSVMACRVFRQLKLGRLSTLDAESWNSQASHPVPLTWRPVRSRAGMHVDSTGDAFAGKSRPTFDEGYDSNVMNIKVTRDVESSIDQDRARTSDSES